jgi:hypothetical protein
MTQAMHARHGRLECRDGRRRVPGTEYRIVGLGKLAHAEFELQVAQILVNLRLALLQVRRRRHRRRLGNILIAHKQNENESSNGEENGYGQHHQSSFSTSFSICS